MVTGSFSTIRLSELVSSWGGGGGGGGGEENITK